MKFPKRDFPSSGSGSPKDGFLKLKGGDKVNVVFKGEVLEFYQIWPFGGEKQIFDQKVRGSSTRFKANVVIFEKNLPPVVKILEFGSTLYGDLAKISQTLAVMRPELSDSDKEKLIERFKITISRTGEGKDDTKWSADLEGPLTESQLRDLDGVKLHTLSNKPKVNLPDVPMPSHDDMPSFDDEPEPEFF
jgi:hypothetical protein